MIEARRCDRLLLMTTLALVSIGAVMIYSSTSVITPALARKNVTEYYYFKKHLFTVFIGLSVMFAAYRTSPEVLRKMAIPLLAVSMLLLVLVFVPGLGVSAGGARRWLQLWPSTFQPSELVKLAMVIFLAWFAAMEGINRRGFAFIAIPVLVLGVFQAVFLKQPDFGAAMSLGVLTLGMLFVAGARTGYMLVLVAICVPIVGKLLMTPYRLKRITSFLNPWEHAQDSGFQLVQSFIAFGSGGLTGVGLGESRQKLDFLPEVHTDFIFSIVGEELGFIVAVIVVLLFVFIFIRGVLIASGTRNEFHYFLCIGLSMMLAFQALVNFSVVVGLLPTKGLPLPFLSYGGSALLVNMAAVGILLNVSRLNSGGEARAVSGRAENLDERIRRKRSKRAVYGRQG